MNKLYLYNTLTRKKEEFHPLLVSPLVRGRKKEGVVGMYTCGPTVYNFAHIGNLRTYLFEDILKRVLLYNGYKVKHVMNITDVGHLTGDMDMGEDKLEVGAKREHKTAWQIAEFYTKAFKNDLKLLNILKPDIWCKATDHIKEQINLIKILEKKGYTYKTSDGIYYDTSKFKNYNKLSHLPLNKLKEGARVEKNEEKKNFTDFALWKFSTPHPSPLLPRRCGRDKSKEREKKGKRQMEWPSPWGVGFPGWHIECSAMSLKFLDGQLDIHCGGIDHINIHHTNEIAQSEAATVRKFFNYWLHGAFLNIADGEKMAKSRENFLTLEKAFIKEAIDPLAFRFAALQTHYRKPMEYSEKGIRAAENGLEHLSNQMRDLTPTLSFPDAAVGTRARRGSRSNINKKYQEKFLQAVSDDLNMPQALAVVQEVLKSKIKDQEKLATVLDFDKVLGLNIKENLVEEKFPRQIWKLIDARQLARDEKNFAESDKLRAEIENLGYNVDDTKDGQRIYKK